MRQSLSLLALLILASACATSTTPGGGMAYQPVLTSVERQLRGGAVEELAPTGANTFEDERIRVVWTPRTTQLDFALTNRSNASARILWDDASFVGIDGRADRIMHAGVKFADRSGSMPPTTIIRGATLDDLVAPVSLVYWQEGLARWQSRALVPAQAGARPTGQLKVLLPVEIQSAVHEYVFVFNLGDATQAEDATTSKITIVRKQEAVAQCRLLGEIAAHPPYWLPGDDFRQLRRKAAELGADTVLVPGRRIGTVEGLAYQCSAK